MEQWQMAKVFNEWMRRYIENPNGFNVEFQAVIEFRREGVSDEEPTYGASCAAYFCAIAKQMGFV